MGNGNILISLAFILAFFYTSCVKDPQDIPGTKIEDPAFTLSGTFGQIVLDIQAGTNGWTMQPGVVPSDSNIVYTSIFSKDGCTNDCSPSLKFQLYRRLPESNVNSQDFQQTISTGDKAFVSSDAERDSFEILLSTHPGLFMSGYSLWDDLNFPGSNFEAQYSST
ncbi:MAG: hypothetical protein M3Q80_02820, partial [bacterium]|nr:hypothetical protein [bacterium]